MKLEALQLRQRGRAEVDFVINLNIGGRPIKQQAAAALDELAAGRELPADLDACHQLLDAQARQVPAFQVKELLAEWHSRYHGVVAMDAFDALGSAITTELDSYNEGPATLDADSDASLPEYWDGVEFHRTAGGWDGHPYMGCVHGEIVHRRIVEGIFPGGIFTQRRKIAALAPAEDYAAILDMGCSTGHFTEALAETYPKAKITGVDISLRALEHARRVANAKGWDWRLLRKPAEATGLDANQFDLVGSFILLHEIPAETIKALFQEAFRVLKPGGDMIMSDVPRLYEMSPLDAWKVDRDARMGGEPHWRSAGMLNLQALAEAVGFEDVVAGGINGAEYPYVVRGRKPQ